MIPDILDTVSKRFEQGPGRLDYSTDCFEDFLHRTAFAVALDERVDHRVKAFDGVLENRPEGDGHHVRDALHRLR